ncbi:H-2 class I histocompatibility antigen, K-B alpha chain-like isoform X2 [Onychostoma macrolepis]|uniref:H-2 class I histocompatibility antigen, K-B alpha chain-like isoform X2 n=1 Tax=Onychostoma macrolepis TaxID=369639 RepID=UPI002729D337|nr:H-2 class I histocompatibility antigen, K-B alpha chain-like isoform X2 [Onychostoma macrolepis]
MMGLTLLYNHMTLETAHHTFQRIIGCEVEKFANGTVMSLRFFDEYGSDGEDFMTFNFDTLQWIVKSPKAKETKKNWDLQTGRNQFIKDYVGKCMEWISTFNNKYKNSPDVYISARRDPDDHSKLVLTCLATGFYPRDIEMNIRLNEYILDNQMCSGIRPNDDETFQMRTSVKIERNFKGSYDCFVIHSSLTEPASVEWDGKCSQQSSIRVIISVSVLVLVVPVIVILCWYSKEKKGSNALMRNHRCGYGAVSEQISMTGAACADTSDEELSADGSTD